MIARRIEARSDETPQAAQPEGREPGAAGTRPMHAADRRKMIVKLGEDLGNLIWEANNRRKAQFLGGR
jgi:hypothetical protein